MASKDDIISELRQIVADQAEQIAALTERVAQLDLQLAKATKDSSNSSKSPSSDIVKPPGKKTGRRKKAKRGGQKGHAKQVREPLPPERFAGSIASNVSRVASARRDDGSRFSPFHAPSSRPFSGHRSQTSEFFGGE